MTFTVESTSHTDVLEITTVVNDHIPTDLDHAIAVVYSNHTTAGLIINEHEPRLCDDIQAFLTELVPEDASYSHDQIDNNAASHLRSLLLGESVIVPIQDGSVSLGTWQSILLVECDGPRTRSITVKCVPLIA